MVAVDMFQQLLLQMAFYSMRFLGIEVLQDEDGDNIYFYSERIQNEL